MQNTPEEHYSTGGSPRGINSYGRTLPLTQPNYNAITPPLIKDIPVQSTQQVPYHDSYFEPTQTRTICGLHRRTFWLILILFIFILLAAVAGGTAGGILLSHNSQVGSTFLSTTSTIVPAPATTVPSPTTTVSAAATTVPTTAATPSTATTTVTAPASTSSSLTIGLFKYLGYYTDSTSHALTGGSSSDSSMTNLECAKFCAGFTYFGTEYCKSQAPYPLPSSLILRKK
jgi:hypothetical protein